MLHILPGEEKKKPDEPKEGEEGDGEETKNSYKKDKEKKLKVSRTFLHMIYDYFVHNHSND